MSDKITASLNITVEINGKQIADHMNLTEACERELLAHLLKKYPFARSDHWARNGAPLDAGVDMATGPDKTAMATLGCGEWNPRLPLAPLFPRILQCLEVKDTMTPESVAKALGLDPSLLDSDEHRPALSVMGTKGPELTAPQAPWPFGNAKPVTLLPEEADEDGHPQASGPWTPENPLILGTVVNVGHVQVNQVNQAKQVHTREAGPKALPANANLMKVR